MKKTNIFTIALISVMALFVMSCNKTSTENSTMSLLEVSTKASTEGVSTFILNNICPSMDETDPLTADEIEFLFAMREDEKLAKDLYTVFAEAYTDNIQFANIARAEANHIAAVERLFEYYEIEFPALGEAGVFANEELQEKYNALVVTETALEAFLVMANIEEEGIAAYNVVLADIANTNIKRIVENMVRASSNHLKAAVRQITKLGGTYTPTVLSQEEFDEIINSNFGKGNKYGQGKGNGNGQGKGGQGNGKGNGGQGQGKGCVNEDGDCTNTDNGDAPGKGGGKGRVGKGYRGGK